MDQSGSLVWLIVLGFAIWFVGLWLAVTWLLGLISGWRRLAARYPDRREIPIDKLSWQSGRMKRLVAYNNCLTLEVCHSGLRIDCLRILRPFDPPFFVPWSEISVVDRGGTILGRGYRLDFGQPVVGSLTVWGKTFDRVAASAPDRLSAT